MSSVEGRFELLPVERRGYVHGYRSWIPEGKCGGAYGSESWVLSSGERRRADEFDVRSLRKNPGVSVMYKINK